MNSPEIALFLWINAGPETPAALVSFARYASDWLPGLAISFLVLAAAVRPGLRRACAQTLLTLLLAWITARLLRHGLALPRPAELGLGTQWIRHAHDPGLPSLHATGAFALAFALLDTRGRGALAAAAFTLAVVIAWSRLLLGVHFPSDVLAGAVVGAFAARMTSLLWAGAARTLSRHGTGVAGQQLKPPAASVGR